MFFTLFSVGATLGFVQTAHCSVMCGPLCLAVCGSSPHPGFALAQYHAARLIAYGTLGAISGWLGSRATTALSFLGNGWISATFSWIIAISLLGSAFRIWRGHSHKKRNASAPSSVVTIGRPAAKRGSKWRRMFLRYPFTLGLLTAFLPCGAMAGGILLAAGTQSAGLGAAAMAGFALASGIGPTLVTSSRWLLPNKFFVSANIRAFALMSILLLTAAWFIYRPLPGLFLGELPLCHRVSQVNSWFAPRFV